MAGDTQQFQEWIRARSTAIWEREGCKPGGAKQYWQRARMEIDEEWRAVLAGERTDVVPPHLTVSPPPIRRWGVENSNEEMRSAA